MQFAKYIKIFQSDGGEESNRANFLIHLQKNGIINQVPCPNTLEHNGVAEQKYRHICEIDLAILLSWLINQCIHLYIYIPKNKLKRPFF